MRTFQQIIAATALFLSAATAAHANPSGSIRCMSMNGNWRVASSVPTPDEPTLNHGMQRFAFERFGSSVGSGECADLPRTYLQSAHAKNFNDLGPTGANADYVWGNLVTTATPGNVNLRNVRPGDIVQIRNIVARFSWGNRTYTQSPTHHTAVVFAVGPDDQDLCVLEQGPGVNVGYGWYNLRGLESGTLKFYRPRY